MGQLDGKVGGWQQVTVYRTLPICSLIRVSVDTSHTYTMFVPLHLYHCFRFYDATPVVPLADVFQLMSAPLCSRSLS